MDRSEYLEECDVSAHDLLMVLRAEEHGPDISAQDSKQGRSCNGSTEDSTQGTSCDVNAHESKEKESYHVNVHDSKEEESCQVNSHSKEEESCCGIVHNSKEEESCRVTAHDSKEEESCHVNAHDSKEEESCHVNAHDSKEEESCHVNVHSKEEESCHVNAHSKEEESCQVNAHLKEEESCHVNVHDSKEEESCQINVHSKEESCRVIAHDSKEEESCRVNAHDSKEEESCHVNAHDSKEEEKCHVIAHNSKEEESCHVNAHDSKDVSAEEESCDIQVQGSKQNHPQDQAEQRQQQVQVQQPDLLLLEQRQVQQQEQEEEEQQQQKSKSQKQRKCLKHQPPHQRHHQEGHQQEQHRLLVTLANEHGEQQHSLQRQSRRPSRLFPFRQSRLRRNTHSYQRPEGRSVNPFWAHRGDERQRQSLQYRRSITEQNRHINRRVNLYLHRVQRVLDVSEVTTHLTQPEYLEARVMLLHLAIALQLLVCNERKFNLTPKAQRQVQGMIPRVLIVFEGIAMNDILTRLAQTEQQMEARMRTQEQHLDSQPPTIQRQHTYQQDNSPQQRQQHSAHASSPQPQPQAEGSQGARLQEPETRHAGRLRHYHSTIQHLLEQGAQTWDDLSEQLVYLHLALAQLHLCERDCRNSPGHSPADEEFLQKVSSMKHKVLKKIYHYEDQLIAKNLLE